MSSAERLSHVPHSEMIALEDSFDGAIQREVEHHPELISRRQKLIFIQETFGWNTVEMGHMLGVSEKEARRYLSRRGMRDGEFESLRDNFLGLFAITSIVKRYVDGLLPRRDTLARPNGLLENKGVKKVIKQGRIYEAVDVAERTFNFLNEN